MPLLFILSSCLVFLGLIMGLGLPLAAGLPLRADEKICAGAALALIAIYLFALVDYWGALPPLVFQLLPLAALAGFALRWRPCLAILRDPPAQHMLGAYLGVAGWLLGFLALVRNYSGGGWALDWIDHYARSLFFLQHWSVPTLILGNDPLPSRPPLANLVTSAFLALTDSACPWFQIFTTLLGSLAFLPGWLFAKRFGHGSLRAVTLFTVLFMLNPSVIENGTFAWTKLITVFFVLSGFYFLLQGMEITSRGRLVLGFLLLAAAFLAHYSAGPYLVALIPAYFWWRRWQWRTQAFGSDTAACALAGAALLATWFIWAIANYGVHGAFLTNTSVAESTVHSWASFAQEKSFNLFSTLIPHPFRAVDYGFIAQTSRLGFARDYIFLLYQVNLPLMFGSFGGAALLWLLGQAWHEDKRDSALLPWTFWAWFTGCTIVLGTAANGGIDHWGVAHLCLQSLLVLGLAFLAAHFDELPRLLRAAFVIGLMVDFILGVGLQFYFENLHHSRVSFMHDAGRTLAATYGLCTEMNLEAKYLNRIDFVGDWPIARPLLVASLACLLGLVLVQLCRARRKALS